jgi:hypothetical protein
MMLGDRRPLKQIGSGNPWLGFGRLLRQTAWGVWWRAREPWEHGDDASQFVDASSDRSGAIPGAERRSRSTQSRDLRI